MILENYTVGEWPTKTKMRIPIKWLKNYIKINKSAEEIAESFTSLGLMLDKPIENNVMDLEHRMDRADWLSIVGCARDLAAFENLKLAEPEVTNPEPEGKGNIKIKVKANDLVNRFNTRVFKDIKVGESPDWLKESLESYGIPSKNNIVDVTNYVMVELGQPLHAQDISKLDKPQIILRNAKKEEKITTLLGESVELDENTLVLSDGKKLLAIGGIVGGEDTGVTNSTTEIILDAGNYDQSNIRKASRRLGIRNETVLRTEKFLHPHLTQVAIERATKLILELAGGEYYSNEDYYPKKVEPKQMNLRFSRIKIVGGIDIKKERVVEILQNLGYKILSEGDNDLELEVPYFRTDILVEDDLVADVLRINDYKNIPIEPITNAPPKEITSKLYLFEEKCRDELVKLGMHEHITNPLTKYSEKSEDQIKLQNSVNSEKDALRTSITQTLEPVLENYKKHKIEHAKIFEIGLIYKKTGSGNSYEDFEETPVIQGLFDTDSGIKEANIEMRKIISAFLNNLGIRNVSYKSEGGGEASIFQNNHKLGKIKLDSFVFCTESLLKADKQEVRVKSKFTHEKTKDVTIEVEKNQPLGKIIENIKSENNNVISVELIDTFEKDNKKSVTFRVTTN